MADVAMAVGPVVDAITGVAALGQGAHEGAVQYQQDATTGRDARAQNQRLLQGPGEFPGYTQNVQGYGQAGPTGQYASLGPSGYATIEPQFTDGAPPPGMAQGNAQMVMGEYPQGTQQQPGYVPTNRAGAQEQVAGAFGMDPGATYAPQDYQRGAEALGLIFSQLMGGGGYGPPVAWFDDGAQPATPAPVTRQGRRS